jgi:hypothetical protein
MRLHTPKQAEQHSADGIRLRDLAVLNDVGRQGEINRFG